MYDPICQKYNFEINQVMYSQTRESPLQSSGDEQSVTVVERW